MARIALLVLVASPLASILIFYIVPSTGSEWASGYNRVAAAIYSLAGFLVVSFIMGVLSLLYSGKYKKTSYFVVVVSGCFAVLLLVNIAQAWLQ